MLKLNRRNKGSMPPNKKEYIYITWQSKTGPNGKSLTTSDSFGCCAMRLVKSPGLSRDRSNHGSSARGRCLPVQVDAVAVPYGCNIE
jgi:hypothetical protein